MAISQINGLVYNNYCKSPGQFSILYAFKLHRSALVHCSVVCLTLEMKLQHSLGLLGLTLMEMLSV